jgi:hypothetical protein
VVAHPHDVLQATVDVLVDAGLGRRDAAPTVARVAGYSQGPRCTAHWPDRVALVRDALQRLSATCRTRRPSGRCARTCGLELVSFRAAMLEHRLDRALLVLAERSPSVPELVPVRDAFVADGERVVRERLAPLLPPQQVDAAVLSLCGAVLHGVLLHGSPPSDAVLATVVDAVVAGLGLDPRA